jgi:hypothetical protein
MGKGDFLSNSVMGRLVGYTLILLIVVSSCTEKKTDTDNIVAENPYSGWNQHSCDNVRILYQSGHPLEAQIGEICRRYVVALDVVAGRLKMEPYVDTLLVVYYTGWGQGREMTGRENSFGTDTAVHFWLPSFLGPSLMQHLLPRWSNKEPRHQFMKHGLISLNDFSGQDYHRSTLEFLDEDRFIPLAALAVDTNTNSDAERYQSAEAASFCAFVLGEWGMFWLKNMYESQLPFDQTVERNLGFTLDSLETLWMLSARANIRPDSTKDSP